MKVSLIVAMGIGRAIGRAGALPWHLPADLAFFKKTTLGKPVVMGRKTHESIGRPLPGRLNIVLSRQAGYAAEGGEVVSDVESALRLAREYFEKKPDVDPELMIIGGEQIYRSFLESADRLYLTEVDAIVGDADAFFPEFDSQAFREVSRAVRPRDEKNAWSMTFLILDRLSSTPS